MQDLRGSVLTQATRQGAGRAVRRDIVVLHALGGTDQARIAHVVVTAGVHVLGSFLDQALHRRAGLPARLLAQLLEDVLQTAGMVAGILQVAGEGLPQLRRSLRWTPASGQL